MNYMLDTNICVLALRNNKNLLSAIDAHKDDELFVSSITLSELEFGVSNSNSQDKNRMAFFTFLAITHALPYDDSAAQNYGELRADLQRRGCPIGELDMFIAAHALSANMTLVTNNTDEFQRVQGLKIEDWR